MFSWCLARWTIHTHWVWILTDLVNTLQSVSIFIVSGCQTQVIHLIYSVNQGVKKRVAEGKICSQDFISVLKNSVLVSQEIITNFPIHFYRIMQSSSFPRSVRRPLCVLYLFLLFALIVCLFLFLLSLHHLAFVRFLMESKI